MSVAGERNLCFRSVNDSCIETTRPTSVQGLLYFVFGSVCCLTVYGNFCVIVTVICIRKLHTPTNYLIFSLALGDLLVGGLTMPTSVVRSVNGCWYFGDIFCQIHTGIDHMLSTFSILHLSCISIDRYYAICHPLLYRCRITAKAALIMILTCWILCTLFGFLQSNMITRGATEEDYYKYNLCQPECVIVNSTTFIAYSLISFYVPSIIIVCINLKIFLVAQRQAHRIQITQCQVMMSGASISKKELKAVRSLAMVIGCFLVCWAPGFITANMYSFSDKQAPHYLVHTLLWISYANSFFNPLIYAFFYSSFRRGFKMINFSKIFKYKSGITQLFSD